MENIRLFVGEKCNNNCVFCNYQNIKAKHEKTFEEIDSELKELKKQGLGQVTLPCNTEIRGDFFTLLQIIKEYGFYVILESNGRLFYYKDFCYKVKSLVDEIHVFKFGKDSEEHDSRTRVSGSFKQLDVGIKHLSKIGADFKVKDLFLSENIRQEAFNKPGQVVIEVTAQCNFDCVGCFNKVSFADSERKCKEMSTGYVKKIIESTASFGISRVRFSGGEPLLREDIFELMAYAKKKGLRVLLNTNATLVTSENIVQLEQYVENVLVSMNGYDNISDLEWTQTKDSFVNKIRGLELLRKSRIPTIRAGTVATPQNIANLDKIYDNVKKLNLDAWEVFRPVPLIPEKNEFNIHELINKLVLLSFDYGKIITIANAYPFCIYDEQVADMFSLGATVDDGHGRIVVDPRGFCKPSYFLEENVGDPLKIEDCWNNKFMRECRNLDFLPKSCKGCHYVKHCKGGSRYAAKVFYGSYSAVDPLLNNHRTTKFSNKDIKLVNCIDVAKYNFPPFGMALLASYLKKQDFKVDQADLHSVYLSGKFNNINIFRDSKRCLDYIKYETEDEDIDRIISYVMNNFNFKGYDFIGLSCDKGSILFGLILAKKLREKTGSKIILGGRQFKTFGKSNLQKLISDISIDFIDFFVIGEAQEAVSKILKREVELQDKPLILDEEEKNESNSCLLIPDYGSYINSYRFKIKDMFKYGYNGMGAVKQRKVWEKLSEIEDSKKDMLILPYSVNKNCVFKCAFCEQSVEQRKFTYLPPERVYEGLSYLKKHHSTNNFFFLDSELNTAPEITKNLSKTIASLGVRFTDSVTFRNSSKDMFRQISNAGGIGLVFGGESYSQRLVDYVGKGFKLNTIPGVLKDSDNEGIWNFFDLIPGLPYETDDDIKATKQFIKGNTNLVNSYYVSPFELRPSLISTNPDKFGLRLRQPILQKFRKIYPFDEINGLSWERKREQIKNSGNQLYQEIKNSYKFNITDQKLLFWLYNCFGNKREVKSFLNDVK